MAAVTLSVRGKPISLGLRPPWELGTQVLRRQQE